MATCGREVHLNDIGTALRVTLYDCDVVVDLTGISTAEIVLQGPDEISQTFTASVYQGDPTLGIIEYLTQANDLDQEGLWKIQAHVVIPTGEWRSDIEKFRVYANL